MKKGTKILLWILIAVAILLAVLCVITLLGNRSVDESIEVAEEEIASPTAEPSPTPDETVYFSLETAEEKLGFPILRWDTSLFQLDANNRMTYADSSVKTLSGIDISEFQYDIDWEKVKADGIDFAMIRFGRRGSTEGGLFIDEYFEKNIEAATAAGLKVGIYFYSQATSVEEAEEEAKFLLDGIKDYKITLPVVYDWEVVGGQEARTYTVSRRTNCDCAKAFCDMIQDAGYQPMIYFTRYLAYRKYILRELTDYGFWYAEYESTPRFAFDFDMWQYSDTGHVDGIEGNVDLDILFIR